MSVVSETIMIFGDIEAIWPIACALEQYPDFMADVNSVTIVERGTDDEGHPYVVADWDTDVDGTPIYWRDKTFFSATNRRIDSHCLEGDMEKFDGEWRFDGLPADPELGTPSGVLVTLRVDYDFGVPELQALIGPTLDIKVRENCQMMLLGMKQHIEAGQPHIEEDAA